MGSARIVTIVLIVLLPSILVFFGAMQGGVSAAPFNIAATVLLMLGVIVHMWAYGGD